MHCNYMWNGYLFTKLCAFLNSFYKIFFIKIQHAVFRWSPAGRDAIKNVMQ